MEMIASQKASTSPPVQMLNQSAAGKSAGAANFQITLTRQLNSETNHVPADGAAHSRYRRSSFQSTAVALEEEAIPAISDLLKMIDDLIDGIVANEADLSDVEQHSDVNVHNKQLIAALDQMNALLNLLGIQVPVSHMEQSMIASDDGNVQPTDSANILNANLKGSIQDALLQLQNALMQGGVKHVAMQEPTLLVKQQLLALTAIMDGEPVETKLNSKTKSDDLPQQLFAAQKSTQPETSTLLHRLTQQSVHPSILTGTTQVSGQTAGSTATGASEGNLLLQSLTQQTSQTAIQAPMLQVIAEMDASGQPVETIPAMQLSQSHAETLRTLANQPSAAQAMTTSYVVADEFAESMTGLIIQKFDITALNGGMEAKLKLFRSSSVR